MFFKYQSLQWDFSFLFLPACTLPQLTVVAGVEQIHSKVAGEQKHILMFSSTTSLVRARSLQSKKLSPLNSFIWHIFLPRCDDYASIIPFRFSTHGSVSLSFILLLPPVRSNTRYHGVIRATEDSLKREDKVLLLCCVIPCAQHKSQASPCVWGDLTASRGPSSAQWRMGFGGRFCWDSFSLGAEAGRQTLHISCSVTSSAALSSTSSEARDNISSRVSVCLKKSFWMWWPEYEGTD